MAADFQRLAELQDRAVRAVMDICPHEWDYLVVSLEREWRHGDMTENAVSAAFRKVGGLWERSWWTRTNDGFLGFIDLHEAMATNDSKRWRNCLLEIDAAGKYRFSFSDDQPLRLNYVFNDESQLLNYTPRPLE